MQHLTETKQRCKPAAMLLQMLDEGNVGAGPSEPYHNSWPPALRQYRDIYLKLAPLLPAAEGSQDNQIDGKRRSTFRSHMRKLLEEKVNIQEVTKILSEVEAESWDNSSREAYYSGFYCCIAACRHAFRWATIPAVKVAQYDENVDLPPELEMPWLYLQQSFEVTADSDIDTANVLNNLDEGGEIAHEINVDMPELTMTLEGSLFAMFYSLEVLAHPIYCEMVSAIDSSQIGNEASCLIHLEKVNSHLRDLLLLCNHSLTDSRISRSVWLSYVQSLQGRRKARIVNEDSVKYDGLWASHFFFFFFQALDAFLGMGSFPYDEDMARCLSSNQRELCIAFRKHCSRNYSKGYKDDQISKVFQNIGHHLQMLKSAQQAREMLYLKQLPPERSTTTVGKSVLERADTKDVRNALEEYVATSESDNEIRVEE